MRAIKATLWGVIVGGIYGAVIGYVGGWMMGMGAALVVPGIVLSGLFIGLAGLGGSLGEPN